MQRRSGMTGKPSSLRPALDWYLVHALGPDLARKVAVIGHAVPPLTMVGFAHLGTLLTGRPAPGTGADTEPDPQHEPFPETQPVEHPPTAIVATA